MRKKLTRSVQNAGAVNSTLFLVFIIAACIFSAVSTMAQTSSSSISGAVFDAQGALVPGAKVSATQVEQSVTFNTVTNASGQFVFPAVIPGTYSVTVNAAGFKTGIETGLRVQPNTNVTAPNVTLAVGRATEAVTVTASAPEIDTEDVSHYDNIGHQELEDFPIDSAPSIGRSYLGALALVQGMVTFEPSNNNNAGTITLNLNGAQQSQNNATLDGILNVDKGGGNGAQLVDINADNVGEMHVATHDADVQYGSMPNTIAVTTASGTAQFHGEGNWFHRNESLNANSWADKRTGTIIPRSKARLNEASGNLGGPLLLPRMHLRNKLFFFVAEDFQSPLLAVNQMNINLPTYAESLGDFSQSHNKNGSPLYLTDYTKNAGKCTSANTPANPGGCFVGVSPISGQTAINVIPQAEQNPIGKAILAIYKNYIPAAGYLGYPSAGVYGSRGHEQTGQTAYNYSDGVSSSEIYRQDLYRVDYNPNPSWQTHLRWVKLVEGQQDYYGQNSDETNLPTTLQTSKTPGFGVALGVTKIFNSSTTNEATAGFNVGKIRSGPTTNLLSKSVLGIQNIPLLYPEAGVSGDQTPDLEFGGSNLTDSPQIVTAGDVPYHNADTPIDVLDNFTKIWGRHEFQAGIQIERLRKDQRTTGATGGVYQFGDDVNNPYDTSDAYANALTGVYDTFNQTNSANDTKGRYLDVDFYVQDTWKVSSRLTVVGGLRTQHWTPWYDVSGLALNWSPTLYNPAAVARIYTPTAKGSTDPGVPGSTFPAAYASLYVPGSGNFENGEFQLSSTHFTNNLGGAIPTVNSKYLYSMREWHIAPRAGITYDLFGNHKTVVRLGAGSYYDQVSYATSMVGNPPAQLATTSYYGTINGLTSSTGLSGVSSIVAIGPAHGFTNYSFPDIWQFNADVQQQLADNTVFTIAYIGSTASHLEQDLNQNWSPYGTCFLPQNQNPAGTSPIPGGNCYAQIFNENYPGLATIKTFTSGLSSNYNSMQASVVHNYRNGLFLKGSYIWSKDLGTSSVYTGGNDYLGRARQLLYAPTTYDRRQVVTVLYSYTLPNLFKKAGILPSIEHSFGDGWELSGVTMLWSGFPISFSQAVYWPGTTTTMSNPELTGSQSETARIQLIGNPFKGVSRGTASYNRLNAAAFQASPAGSFANPLGYLGLGMRNDQYPGPGVNDTDLSLQKSFALHSEGVRLQLRMDAFNAFNHTSYTGYNTTVTFPLGPNSVGNPSYTTSSGTMPNEGSASNTSGFGAVNGANPNRVVSLMARVRF